MTQLVEWSLPIPEVRGSSPVISKNLYRELTVNCIEKTKNEEKRGREWTIFNNNIRGIKTISCFAIMKESYHLGKRKPFYYFIK